MYVIEARNVNDALFKGLWLLSTHGHTRESRNGLVKVFPTPVTTVYERPYERVLLYPQRDANPFFHLYEALWMLAGRNDVDGVAAYVGRMRSFSDDGKTLHGAYGARWRRWFTAHHDGQAYFVDQLLWAIDRLRKDKNDRRVVVQMWDAGIDPAVAESGGKDVPCNTQLYLWVDLLDRLCLTVTCRSNDMIWGAYGANAVHFSFLQEYVARALGRSVGPMWQVSNNYHAYVDVLEKLQGLEPQQPYGDPAFIDLLPLHQGDEKVFDEDVQMLLNENVTIGLRTPWLRRVAVPMIRAHQAYSDKKNPERHETALEVMMQCKATDWRRAGVEWITRRLQASLKAKDDGVQHDE